MASFAPSAPGLTRESTLTNLLVLAHRPLVASPAAKYDWITPIEGAGLDLGKLLQEHGSKLRDLIWDAIRDRAKVCCSLFRVPFSFSFSFSFPREPILAFLRSVPDIL